MGKKEMERHPKIQRAILSDAIAHLVMDIREQREGIKRDMKTIKRLKALRKVI